MTDRASQDTPAEPDLDALLDDALNDFEETDQSFPEPSKAPASTQPAQHKGKPLGLGRGLGKSLAPKPKAKKSQAQSAPAPSPLFPGLGRGFGAIPPDVGDQDELAANFQKMMADLAHVDLSKDDERLPNIEPAVPGNHDLAATLNALAANSGSLGAGPPTSGQPLHPDTMNEEMFNRMSEQLDALGRDAAASSSDGSQQPAPEDMSGLVDGIMQQLLAKDVLYQPIQEIGARYPQWLSDHREGMSSEDYQRYSEQYVHIQQITKLYEEEPDNYTKLVDLLQQMQSCGQPPQDIVDEMAPGLGSLDSQGPLGGLGALGGLGLPGLSKGNSACCIQ